MADHSTEPTPAGPASAAERAAYRAETATVLRQRLDVAVLNFVVLMGIGTVFELCQFPARRVPSATAYVAEVAVAGIALIACRTLRVWPGRIGGLLAGALAALITGYHGWVGAPAERVTMVLCAVLNLLAVTLPWGWAAQAAAAGTALASFIVAAPFLAAGDDSRLISFSGMFAGAATSVCGAYFLDRYRFEAFRRTRMHAAEAEIAATLVDVTQALSARLGSPDMLERVTELAVCAIGCDWSSIFLIDEERHAYRLAANYGSTSASRRAFEGIEFAADSFPLLPMIRPSALIAIEDPVDQVLVPADVLRQAEQSSALYAAIARADRLVGFVVIAYRTRTGPFSEKERRLTAGIAHATAVALENARLIAELQAASHLKSEFVATMSHELRTPLNVITGYSEMLADGVYAPGDAGWRDTVARIQRSAIELFDLVNATLDVGRLEAGREVVQIGPLDVGALFADLAKALAPLAPPGVHVVWDDRSDGRTILTDRGKIATIVKNLVGNALKFTPAGRVTVTAAARDGELVLEVRDTGVGIAPEHLPLIFEMFRQLDASPTSRTGGVGLGLHIVQRLVDLLGGHVAVTSAPNVGSTFIVRVPAAATGSRRAAG